MSRPEAARTAAPDLVELCAFLVAEEEYVLDIMRVREVIRPHRITAVPRAPAFVAGVLNLRGAVVPVVDLRERMGLPRAPPGRKGKFLICSVGSRRVGLVVDEVTGVVRIPRGEIRPAPSLLSRDGPRFFLGICGPPDRLKLLLNVKALLESREAVPDAKARALARDAVVQTGATRTET